VEERRERMKKSASIGRTYNMGNFESLRMEIGFESDDPTVDEGELYQACKETLATWEKDQGIKRSHK
jgi:hypothetical protein